MATATSIPVTVTPEAVRRVVELGMEAELERMLEHTQRTIPGLRRIDVVLEPPYDTGDEPYITIEAMTDPASYTPDDLARSQWGVWKVEAFPPDVNRHFSLLILYGAGNAG